MATMNPAMMAALVKMLQQQGGASAFGSGGPPHAAPTPPQIPGLTAPANGSNAMPAPMPGANYSEAGAQSSLPPMPAPLSYNTPKPQRALAPAGTAYANPQARTEAIASSLFQGLGSMISSIEERKQKKTAAQAELYVTQILGLLGSGDPKDKEKAQMLIDDPKINKTLKKGVGGNPFEVELEPETKGVMSGVKKFVSKLGQQKPQQGQSQQQPRRISTIPSPDTASRMQAVQRNALMQNYQHDPQKAALDAGQSALSSNQQYQAQFFEAQLGISPATYKSMDSRYQIAAMQSWTAYQKMSLAYEASMYRTDKMAGAQTDSAKMRAGAMMGSADIRARAEEKSARIKAKAAGDPVRLLHGIAGDAEKHMNDFAKLAQKATDPKEKAHYQQQSDSAQALFNYATENAKGLAADMDLKKALGFDDPDDDDEDDDQ